jgi:hypothetical protein
LINLIKCITTTGWPTNNCLVTIDLIFRTAVQLLDSQIAGSHVQTASAYGDKPKGNSQES